MNGALLASMRARGHWKLAVGIALGFGIGLGCRALGIPSPAPPVLDGALLVVAMTSGYLIADRFLATRAARHNIHCGGPTGDTVAKRASNKAAP